MMLIAASRSVKKSLPNIPISICHSPLVLGKHAVLLQNLDHFVVYVVQFVLVDVYQI